MRIVVSGGGTAGHITPALALAEALEARGHEVFFAGTPTGVESTIVPEAGVQFKAFEAAGFDRKRISTLFSGVSKILKSTGLAVDWLREIDADAVVGFGGYVCIPVARAAIKLNIPVILHEQNSVMGLANKYLAKKAAVVCLTYACAGEGVEAKRYVVTGNPVRRAVLDASRDEGRKMLGIPDDALMLLVFGGSLGARHINQAICAMKDELLAEDNLYIVHITGPKELDSVLEALALTDEEAQRYIVMGYQNRMGETLAATDMTVARCGASSLAEISALAIPAILVPFPYATADHQTTNARAYCDAGCARLITDDQVESPEFHDALLELIRDADVREAMHEAARQQKAADAADTLADVVLSAAQA